MAISLKKGQKIDLTKTNPGLSKILVGLGWDTNKYDGGAEFDLDTSIFLVDATGKATSDSDFIFYNNPTHPSGSVQYMGDNRTGEGDGDDEQILVDLANLPSKYCKIAFVVTIYKADERNQNFGMIKNAYIRIVDTSNGNKELCKFNLSDDINYNDKTSMLFGELYRHNGEWKFNAIGEGLYSVGISNIVNQNYR